MLTPLWLCRDCYRVRPCVMHYVLLLHHPAVAVMLGLAIQNTASSQGMWLIYSCHLLSILNTHTSFHVAPYLTMHSYSLCDIYGLWWDHTFLGKWIHLRPSHWAVSGSSALQTSSATVSSAWQAERLADQAAFAFLLSMKKKKKSPGVSQMLLTIYKS